MNRRKFAAGIASFGTSAILDGNWSMALPRASRTVVVVGAGIAGLTAAYELLKSGYDVQVFEARMRPGGRIYTMRRPFSNGLYAEAGAIDVGDGYSQLMRYVREFDLPLIEQPLNLNQVFYIRGKRYVMAPGQEPNWPVQMDPAERRLGQAGLWKKYVTPMVKEVGDPASSGWLDARTMKYDRTTLNRLLIRHGLSSDALSLFRWTLNGDDFDHVSALQSLSIESFEARNTRWLGIGGGNEQLPMALAAKLGGRIHYGTAVIGVAQNQIKCRVTTQQSGVQQHLEADHVILAIPFSVLRRIELDGSFSIAKRDAISALRYESITGVFLQSKRRVWNDAGNAGSAITDLPVGALQEIGAAKSASGGVLQSLTEGKAARKTQSMNNAERISWATGYFDRVHPGFAASFETGASIAWDEEPWSLGAWAYYAPGEMKTIFPNVARAEGRMHFAGEHTTTDMTLEGAARSGHRAASEVASYS